MTSPRIAPPLALALAVVLPSTATAGTIDQIGTFGAWPTVWTPVPGLDDPAGEEGTYANPIPERLDFVGDGADPALSVANEGGYLFFRVRMNGGTVVGSGTDPSRTYKDDVAVLIDVVGQTIDTGTGQLIPTETPANQRKPDYGFAWDSKLAPAFHGLEMQTGNNTYFGVWGSASLQDIDGDAAAKGVNDINGGGRTTDGYLRTIDSQPSTNFGTTSFIDYAISWAYLAAYTDLQPGQTWYLTAVSGQNNNDHADVSADVAGGADISTTVTSPTAGWAEVRVPAPAPLALLGVGLLPLLALRRRRG